MRPDASEREGESRAGSVVLCCRWAPRIGIEVAHEPVARVVATLATVRQNILPAIGPPSHNGTTGSSHEITKTGNSHLPRALVESAWYYRHRPGLCKRQKERQSSLSPKVATIAWSAQERLHRRYWALTSKSKPSVKVVTALARELAGFVWGIGVETERAQQ